MAEFDRVVATPAFTACRPEGQRSICGQCRRWLSDDLEHHHDDGTSRCPPGLAEAVRRLATWITGVALP
jgi:hypothetical protein